jgi:hypothetical protein
VHARAGLLPPVVTLAVTGLALLCGCTSGSADTPQRAAASGSGSPAPSLGAPTPSRRTTPAEPMNRLEGPVARMLARQIAPQGLTLEYLDCPHWDGVVPRRLTCRAYVDGLLATATVRLAMGAPGQAVDVDAWLGDGVIATDGLEDILRRQGWVRPDCGPAAAYPARVGSRIVCRVSRDGQVRYVAATVRSRAGAVMIADARGG